MNNCRPRSGGRILELPPSKSGNDEAIILVKAAPVIGRTHGETVCCAGMDLYGNWLRLFPVSFRVLDDGKKFARWDRVKFTWRKPTNDDRQESRHVNNQTLEIVGSLKKSERAKFLDRQIVTSLNAQREAGKSLALLKPEIYRFWIEKREDADIAEEQVRIDAFHAQADLFIPRPAVPRTACPYSFKYEYATADGKREGTCQDWESTATYFRWSKEYGEKSALREMEKMYGETMPQRGLYFAMGTHSRWPDTWLINGLIQIRFDNQPSMF